MENSSAKEFHFWMKLYNRVLRYSYAGSKMILVYLKMLVEKWRVFYTLLKGNASRYVKNLMDNRIIIAHQINNPRMNLKWF